MQNAFLHKNDANGKSASFRHETSIAQAERTNLNDLGHRSDFACVRELPSASTNQVAPRRKVRFGHVARLPLRFLQQKTAIPALQATLVQLFQSSFLGALLHGECSLEKGWRRPYLATRNRKRPIVK